MTDTATDVLTDQGVPIGWSIIADRPEFAYLADADASRPATEAEMAELEEAAREEYRVAMLPKPPSPLPHPAMCGCNALAAAAAAAAVQAPDTAPEPAPGPIRGDCQDDAPVTGDPESEREPEAADDPAPELDPIRELALERFTAEHDAEDKRTATVQIEAVGDSTEVIEGSETA